MMEPNEHLRRGGKVAWRRDQGVLHLLSANGSQRRKRRSIFASFNGKPQTKKHFASFNGKPQMKLTQKKRKEKKSEFHCSPPKLLISLISLFWWLYAGKQAARLSANTTFTQSNMKDIFFWGGTLSWKPTNVFSCFC